MLAISLSLQIQFDMYLRTKNVPKNLSPFYKKWLRYYLDYCHKYHAVPIQRESLSLFLDKLQEKKQTKAQQGQVLHAISLYYELLQHLEYQGNAQSLPKLSLSEKTVEASPSPPDTLSSRKTKSNGVRSHRKMYSESSPPPVSCVSEPHPQTGAFWGEEYTSLVSENLENVSAVGAKVLSLYSLQVP